MPDTIDIAGKPVKKQTAIIAAGAAVVLGIGIYRYRKQQAANAAAQSATDATGTGTGTADQIDPATGFPYGSVEDASALTSQAGYVSPIGGLGTSGVSYSYAPPSQYPTSGGFTSNAQWSQAVEDYLVNTTGADANTVGNALGKYITGQVVTSDQQAIINQGIAFQGYPPVPGPEGYPPSIRTGSPTSTQPPPPPPPPTTKAGSIASIRITSRSRTGFVVAWSAAAHASQGYAYEVKQLNGVSKARGTTQNLAMSFSGLHPGWTYNFGVQGLPGGPGKNIRVTLPR